MALKFKARVSRSLRISFSTWIDVSLGFKAAAYIEDASVENRLVSSFRMLVLALPDTSDAANPELAFYT